ncbi:MAG: hypothetical protein IBJ11_04390 [Phycisphaerales bacterium]|nr:hypothetical protein [Phycisphaerales bacterium]
MSLEALVTAKPERRLGIHEAVHAARQLMSCAATLEAEGVPQGRWRSSDVLVDRRGALHAELVGVEAALSQEPAAEGPAVVRSLGEVLFQAATGARAGGGPPARALNAALPRRFAAWLDSACGGGFKDFRSALAALPG